MDIATAATQYREATDLFLNLISGLDEKSLDTSDGEGWTPRQVIHHVADSEAQSYARLRRLVAEPGTIIQGYDEGAWGENSTLGYSELPIEISVAVYTAVRASSLEIIKRLKQDQLNNSGFHSESGEYTIHNWLENYINHPRDHAAQIEKILE
ncbi:MAG: hypothetical protein RL130_267 [Actinomycetota bacterium]